eukprot:m.365268 g.365268  ORF g.365268 m.365268 type:complete len:67 (-) comp30673_c0_seq1:38-238(-)
MITTLFIEPVEHQSFTAGVSTQVELLFFTCANTMLFEAAWFLTLSLSLILHLYTYKQPTMLLFLLV